LSLDREAGGRQQHVVDIAQHPLVVRPSPASLLVESRELSTREWHRFGVVQALDRPVSWARPEAHVHDVRSSSAERRRSPFAATRLR
jgi:hypothetical protein